MSQIKNEWITLLDLVNKLRSYEYRVPYSGQRGAEWNDEDIKKWLDSVLKFPFKNDVPPIRIGVVNKDIPCQRVSSIYDTTKPEEPISLRKQIITSNIIDGSQRARASYSACYGSIIRIEKGEVVNKVVYFNITKKASYTNINDLNFNIYKTPSSGITSIVKKTVKGMFINFPYLIERLEMLMLDEISFDDVINDIKQLLNDEYNATVEDNIKLLLNSCLFNPLIEIKKDMMTDSQALFIFSMCNNRKGRNILSVGRAWILFKECYDEFNIVNAFCRELNIKNNMILKIIINLCHSNYIDTVKISKGYHDIIEGRLDDYPDIIKFLYFLRPYFDVNGLVESNGSNLGYSRFLSKISHNISILYFLWIHRHELDVYFDDDVVRYIKGVFDETIQGDHNGYKELKRNINNNPTFTLKELLEIGD